jgi:hypothetical protein
MPHYRIHVNGETTPQTRRYATKKEVREAAARDGLRDGSYSVIDESKESETSEMPRARPGSPPADG